MNPIFNASEDVTKQYLAAKQAVTDHVHSQIKKGDKVRWGFGKYKGRLAQVRQVIWDFDSFKNRGRLTVQILVETYRIGHHKGLRGDEPFLLTEDYEHRHFYDVNNFTKVSDDEEVHQQRPSMGQ